MQNFTKRGKLHLSSSEYQLKRHKNNSSEHWSHETRIGKENQIFLFCLLHLTPIDSLFGQSLYLREAGLVAIMAVLVERQ
jgi:hypothetical protein